MNILKKVWRQKSAGSNAIKGEWQWLTLFVTHFIIQLYAYVLLEQAYKPQWPLSVAKYCGTVTTLNTGGSTSNLRVSKCTTTTKKKFVQQQQKNETLFPTPTAPPPNPQKKTHTCTHTYMHTHKHHTASDIVVYKCYGHITTQWRSFMH